MKHKSERKATIILTKYVLLAIVIFGLLLSLHRFIICDFIQKHTHRNNHSALLKGHTHNTTIENSKKFLSQEDRDSIEKIKKYIEHILAETSTFNSESESTRVFLNCLEPIKKIKSVNTKIFTSLPVYFDNSSVALAYQNKKDIQLCIETLCQVFEYYFSCGMYENANDSLESAINLIAVQEICDTDSFLFLAACVELITNKCKEKSEDYFSLDLRHRSNFCSSLAKMKNVLHDSYEAFLYSKKHDILYTFSQSLKKQLPPNYSLEYDNVILLMELIDECVSRNSTVAQEGNLMLDFGSEHQNRSIRFRESIENYVPENNVFDLQVEVNSLLLIQSFVFKCIQDIDNARCCACPDLSLSNL